MGRGTRPAGPGPGLGWACVHTGVNSASCGRGRGRGHVAHGPVGQQLSSLEVVVQMPSFSRHGDLRAGEPGCSYLSPTHEPQPLAAV